VWNANYSRANWRSKDRSNPNGLQDRSASCKNHAISFARSYFLDSESAKCLLQSDKLDISSLESQIPRKSIPLPLPANGTRKTDRIFRIPYACVKYEYFFITYYFEGGGLRHPAWNLTSNRALFGRTKLHGRMLHAEDSRPAILHDRIRAN